MRVRICRRWDLVPERYYWKIKLGGIEICSRLYSSKASAKRGFERWRDRCLKELGDEQIIFVIR